MDNEAISRITPGTTIKITARITPRLLTATAGANW